MLPLWQRLTEREVGEPRAKQQPTELGLPPSNGPLQAARHAVHVEQRHQRAFLRMNDHRYFSIVQLPRVAEIPIEIGKTHAGSGGPSAPGTLQHLAFGVDTDADLLAMRDRIRSHGVNVIGPIDHGMCRSIYFAGPDQMTLEVATSQAAIDPAPWIDPV